MTGAADMDIEKLSTSGIPEDCLEILRSPILFKDITEMEFDKKIGGEENARKTLFLLACSIFVKNLNIPENTIINASSSSGKDHLTKSVLEIFPKDLWVYRSRISPEAFTYWKANEPNWSWTGKVCYLEDVSEKVINCPTFKTMSSGGSTATIVVKNVAVDFDVKGIPCIFLTTAESNPNNEVLNRFNFLFLDESQEQTKQVIDFVTSEHERKEKREYEPKVTEALTHLKRVEIFIPYAKKIAPFFPSIDVSARREISRILGFIKCSAALHQYQRNIDSEGKVLATKEDYELGKKTMANLNISETLTKLTHHQVKAYESCKTLAKETPDFTAKDISVFDARYSLKHWYTLLSAFSKKGLLGIKYQPSGDSVKEVKHYFIKKNPTTLSLPSFEELIGGKLG